MLRSQFQRFRAAKSGGALIYVVFALPLLLGAFALSLDLGRAFILNTELKDFSDAAALAGAAELDGRDGAREAAELAARTGVGGNLVNLQAFATDGGGPGIVVDKVVFLQNLPADGTDFVETDTATGDSNARFIFVSVANRNVRSGLSRALGIIPNFETSARSIAGFNSVTCRVPPIMMCNPLEADGSDPDIPAFPVPDPSKIGGYVCQLGPGRTIVGEQAKCLEGRQLLAKKSGPNSAYVPGNFGMLDPTVCSNMAGINGANCLAEQLAAHAPDFCVAGDVDFNPGQSMGPVRAAINTRFDIYKSPHFGGESANPNYPPALNVVKGLTEPFGSTCNASEPAAPAPGDPPIALPYPRDLCFPTDCAGGRFGDGSFDPGPYWAVNHKDPHGRNPPTDLDGPFFKNYADMTRYEIYRHEIENGIIPDNSLTDGENANPTCYSGTTPIPDPTVDSDELGIDETDRRLIVMAAVNCVQWEDENVPDTLSGNESNVPTIGFIKVFLTEPVLTTGQTELYVELAGVQQPGETDVFRDIVQLYR